MKGRHTIFVLHAFLSFVLILFSVLGWMSGEGLDGEMERVCMRYMMIGDLNVWVVSLYCAFM